MVRHLGHHSRSHEGSRAGSAVRCQGLLRNLTQTHFCVTTWSVTIRVYAYGIKALKAKSQPKLAHPPTTVSAC